MSSFKSNLIYNAIINFPIALMLSIASQILSKADLDVPIFILNVAISYAISMVVGLSLPLVKIGKWFTGLFKVKNDTYTHNVRYRFLATFIISTIYFVCLNPSISFFNSLVLNGLSFKDAAEIWLERIPPMFVVGFVSSLVYDIPAYRFTKSVDPNF